MDANETGCRDSATSVDVHTLTSLLYSAHKLNQRSLAAEVADSIKSARAALENGLNVSVKTQRQADYVARRIASAKTRIAELEALHKSFASCRGEIGTLPVFRDKEAVCEPEIAKWANRLQEEVEEMAWLSVKAQDDAARFRAGCAALDEMEGVW